jgi:minor histocompatibility antigen H13
MMPPPPTQTPQAIKRRARKLQHKAAVLDPDDEDDDIDDEERLSMTDSLLFPVFGSATLLGIFLIFKYLGTEWINWILGIYCE